MVHDINSVILVGRLTRDVAGRDFAYLPNGTACATASIAVNRSRKQGESWVDEVSFFDITIFGKTAESLRPYLQKGKMIAIQGSLRQDRWEKDGQRFSRIHIVAENVQLLGGNPNGNSSASGAQENSATPAPPEDIPF